MATWPTTIDDDGTGTSGTILDDAFFDQVKAYIDEVGGAAWDPITLTATATAGTVTLSAITAQANVDPIGKRVFVDLVFTAATTASTTFIYITLPGTLPPTNKGTGGSFNYWGPGISGTGLYQTVTGQRRVDLLREAGGTPWPIHAGINFYMQLSYPY